MEENFLIAETTKDERKAIVKKALTITVSGTDYPSKKVLALAKKYIDGEMELSEVQEAIIGKSKDKDKEEK